MRSRSFALAAVLLALGISASLLGCSKAALPTPTINNSGTAETTSTASTSTASATLGKEATITVTELASKLRAEGLKVSVVRHDKSGVFKPATLQVLNVDGSNVQTYRFKDAKQGLGAARTVENDGFVLGYTPSQYVTVNWAGWPAFFRSGNLIVIFITGKDAKADVARDKRVFDALVSVFGPPFIGGQTAPASLSKPTTSTTVSVPATGAP